MLGSRALLVMVALVASLFVWGCGGNTVSPDAAEQEVIEADLREAAEFGTEEEQDAAELAEDAADE